MASFVESVFLDPQAQEKAMWKTAEYLGITGGAPLAFGLYALCCSLTFSKLDPWKAVVLAFGGIVVFLSLCVQRWAFGHFIRRRREEWKVIQDALIDFLNNRDHDDSLRKANQGLEELKKGLDNF